MSEKHHIEISVCKVDGDSIIFKMEHTPCELCICETGNEFVASNGIVISSGLIPFSDDVGIYIYAPKFVIGNGRGEMVCSAEDFALVMHAVSEYNENDVAGDKKPWPQRGDIYYVIWVNGRIISLSFDEEKADLYFLSSGNMFRTREEAESARELVKKALKGVDENKLLREALEEAVSMYGKPGGPWNVPGDAGGWISKARKALEVGNE